MTRSVVSILAVAWAFSAGRTLAEGDPVLQHLRACETEANDAARLVCYDSAIGRTQQRMRAKVVAVTQSPTGKFTVTLDNGHRNRQTRVSRIQ
jgi:hypothetical protein